MGFFSTIWADLKKVLDFATIWAPVAAIADPNAAAGIANAQTAIASLQPIVASIAATATAPLTHEQMVDAVTNVVAASSAVLVKTGAVSTATDQHIQALAPVIHAAVIASGLASTAPASPPPAIVP